jgi:hypothetical protein
MANELDELIARVNKDSFSGTSDKLVLRWYIRDYGVSSDQRRNCGRLS